MRAVSDEILLSVDKPARYVGGEVNMVKKDVKFCSSCGHAMTPPAEDSADTEAAAPSESEKEAEERVCTKCGAKLTECSAFCSECGTKV